MMSRCVLHRTSRVRFGVRDGHQRKNRGRLQLVFRTSDLDKERVPLDSVWTLNVHEEFGVQGLLMKYVRQAGPQDRRRGHRGLYKLRKVKGRRDAIMEGGGEKLKPCPRRQGTATFIKNVGEVPSIFVDPERVLLKLEDGRPLVPPRLKVPPVVEKVEVVKTGEVVLGEPEGSTPTPQALRIFRSLVEAGVAPDVAASEVAAVMKDRKD